VRFSKKTDLPPNPIVGLSDKISQISKTSPDFIPMQQGEMAFPTPKEISEAAYRSIKEGYTRYAPALGYPELRTEIAKKLQSKNKIKCDPHTELLVTEGSTEALYVAFQTLLEPDDEVLVFDPSYAPYGSAIRATGAKPVQISSHEQDDWTPTLVDIEKSITRKTRIILLNTPNNPTGEIYKKEFVKDLAEIAVKHDITLLSDEAYEGLVYDGFEHFSPGSLNELQSNCVTAFSFSKTFAMTGWRLGYLLGPREFIQRASVIHNLVIAHVSSPIQMAGVAALGLPRSVTDHFVNILDKRRRVLVEELNAIPNVSCRFPKGTFYAFPNLTKTGLSSTELAELFMKKRVGASPGSFFGSCAEGYMRLCFATVTEDQILEATKRIRESLRD